MPAGKEGDVHKTHNDKKDVLEPRLKKKITDSKRLGEMMFSRYWIRKKQKANAAYKKTYFTTIFWSIFLYNVGLKLGI